MLILRVIALLFIWAQSVQAQPADVLFLKKESASGSAVIQPAGQEKLQKGSTIRTSKDSFADFLMDDRLESFMRVEAESDVTVLTQPANKLSLKQGTLLILRERDMAEMDSPEGPLPDFKPITLVTPQATLVLRSGGFVITANEHETWIQVFADSAEISRFEGKGKTRRLSTVDEGFKMHLTADKSTDSFERLQYTDYVPWQNWSRRIYERRDDATRARMLKLIRAMRP